MQMQTIKNAKKIKTHIRELGAQTNALANKWHKCQLIGGKNAGWAVNGRGSRGKWGAALWLIMTG